MRIAFIFLLSIICFASSAQSEAKQELDFYGDVMIYAYESEHRLTAAKKFKSLFDDYISNTAFIDDDLKWLKWVSVLYPENESFRLVSWQVKESDNKHHYYGFVQFSDGKRIDLNGGDEYWNKIAYDQREADDCPMVMYYNMKQLSENEYLLFGINEFNEYEKIKVADVLVISDDQEIQFGAPVFQHKGEDPKYRLVLQYADDAVVSLNYNEDLNLLIYDHLISRMGRIPNQGVTSLPDGSYEAYKIEGDKLTYIEKVYDHVFEQAPRPVPKDESKDAKDIFGKTKKKKGS